MNPTAERGGTRTVLLRRQLSPDQQARIASRLHGAGTRREVTASALRKSNAAEAPLSFAQQRFWFLDQLDSYQAPHDRVSHVQPVYHVAFGLRLSGPLNCEAVESSVSEIVRRHEALRTVFRIQNGSPAQIVCPPTTVKVPIKDLVKERRLNGARPSEISKKELREAMAEEAGRPFDLTRDLMLRSTLFRTAADEHVLLFTMHHIASDAWSIRLLLEEWVALYRAECKSESAELPELPIQYVDFALWQRQSVESTSFRKQIDYWKQKLADEPPRLELPCDRPVAHAGELSNRGALRSMVLSRELSGAVTRFAHQHGATQFMTLLAAFKALLYRYSDQEDFAVGSPVARRALKETEHLIGLFLNISVLRTDLSGDPTFKELLDRVRETALEAYAHQDVPFEKIVEELQPTRDPGRTPFFQVMFSFQEAPMPIVTVDSFRSGAQLLIEAFEFDLNVAPFDLTLLAQDTPAGLDLTVEYKTDLFSGETIDRLLGHFRTLLEAALENPAARISELPLLTLEERRQLLAEFNPPQVEFPREKCVHELFEEQARRTPDGVAVKFGSHSLTYCELNERANRLAHYLMKLGVGPESLVGICMERSFEMMIGVLAVLKAGGAYVPVEPDEAEERLAFKLRDSGMKILLTQQVVLSAMASAVFSPGTVGQNKIEVVCLDRDRHAINAHPRTNPMSGVRPNNLIYMIYTSGSTGVPKGVLVEHRSVVNHSIDGIRRFGLTSADRVLQFAPLSFDVSAEEMFPTLLSGGTLVLRPAGLAVAAQDFHPFLVHENLTVVNLPTPYWSQWLSIVEKERLSLPSSLRLVVAGSDTISREHYALWRKLTRGEVRWCNAYGTTETTITATIYEPDSNEVPDMVPIGRPGMNTQVYILDQHRNLVPIGVPGEIYIGGEEVARGYLNRPEATAANFVPDPFNPQPGARLNRTGDFGRWRADGNIEFLGRRDNQVKIRGFRIELGEVEAALLQYPAVREAVVVPREIRGEKSLVAYLVADDTAGQLVGKVLQFLKLRLPAYMIPAAVVPMPELPRLSSGKVDLKALPAPGTQRPDLEGAFVAPADSLEEKLAYIWCQVLGLEKIGVHDDFFDLGGHSLLAVRLFAEIEKLTGWNLPIVILFQSPTIKGLADTIRRTQSSETHSSILTVQPHGTKPPLFLIHGAAGGMLWGYANLAKHLGSDQPVYAFDSRGLAGREEPSTIEELAAQYVRELREFQPRGPYYLGGYCFGGEVAFEMAQQLVAQGQRVGLAFVMNGMAPNSSFERIRVSPLWLMRFARNSWHWFSYFCRGWTPEQRRTFIGRKLRACRKQFRALLKLAPSTNRDAEDEVDMSLYTEEQRRLWDVHLRASANYHPRPYPGRVAVFRTRTHPFFCSFDPTFGWGELAEGRVTVKIVPGAHESILDEPYVQVTAAQLRGCLAEAHERAEEVTLPESAGQKVGRMVLSCFLYLMDFAPAI